MARVGHWLRLGLFIYSWGMGREADPRSWALLAYPTTTPTGVVWANLCLPSRDNLLFTGPFDTQGFTAVQPAQWPFGYSKPWGPLRRGGGLLEIDSPLTQSVAASQ